MMKYPDFFSFAQQMNERWKMDLNEAHLEAIARNFRVMFNEGLLAASDMTSSELEWSCYDIRNSRKKDQ
jgi:hypothetical protein